MLNEVYGKEAADQTFKTIRDSTNHLFTETALYRLTRIPRLNSRTQDLMEMNPLPLESPERMNFCETGLRFRFRRKLSVFSPTDLYKAILRNPVGLEYAGDPRASA